MRKECDINVYLSVYVDEEVLVDVSGRKAKFWRRSALFKTPSCALVPRTTVPVSKCTNSMKGCHRVTLLLALSWIRSLVQAGHNDVIVTAAPTMSAVPSSLPTRALPSQSPSTSFAPSMAPSVSAAPTELPSVMPSEAPTASSAPTALPPFRIEYALDSFTLDVEQDDPTFSKDRLIEVVTNVFHRDFQSAFGVHFDRVDLSFVEQSVRRRRTLQERRSFQFRGITFFTVGATEVGITHEAVRRQQAAVLRDIIAIPYDDGAFIVGATLNGTPLGVTVDENSSDPSNIDARDESTFNKKNSSDQIVWISIIAGVVAVLLLILLCLVVRRQRLLAKRSAKQTISTTSELDKVKTTPKVKRVRDLDQTPPLTGSSVQTSPVQARPQLVHRGLDNSSTTEVYVLPRALSLDESVEDARNISTMSTPPPPADEPISPAHTADEDEDNSMTGFSLASRESRNRTSNSHAKPHIPHVLPAPSSETIESESMFTYGHVAEHSDLTYGFNPYGKETGSIQRYLDGRFSDKATPPPPRLESNSRDILNDSEITEKRRNIVDESYDSSVDPLRAAALDTTLDDDASEPGIIQPKPRSPERKEKADDLFGISADLEDIGRPRASAISDDGHHFRSPQAARLFEYLKEKRGNNDRIPDV